MISKEQLPYLFKLLDDPSQKVKNGVLKGFSDFGRQLYTYLREDALNLKEANLKELFGELNLYLREQKRTHDFNNYHVGQLIDHQRYQYQGVIVDSDLCFMGSDSWYQSNTTQPEKLQPWYHVLVNQSTTTTYAAESSLLESKTFNEISHPYIPFFFDGFENNRYVRNDRPWPEN